MRIDVNKVGADEIITSIKDFNNENNKINMHKLNLEDRIAINKVLEVVNNKDPTFFVTIDIGSKNSIFVKTSTNQKHDIFKVKKLKDMPDRDWWTSLIEGIGEWFYGVGDEDLLKKINEVKTLSSINK